MDFMKITYNNKENLKLINCKTIFKIKNMNLMNHKF